MHVTAHWTLTTLRRELAKTQDFIRARQSGMAPKQIGLTAAIRREAEIKKIINQMETKHDATAACGYCTGSNGG